MEWILFVIVCLCIIVYSEKERKRWRKILYSRTDSYEAIKARLERERLKNMFHFVRTDEKGNYRYMCLVCGTVVEEEIGSMYQRSIHECAKYNGEEDEDEDTKWK